MALVAVPSHRIHSAFGAPSFASISGAGGPSHSHLQASFNAQPNVSYNSTRARSAPLSILAARTAAAAAAAQVAPTPVVTRPRRPSIRSVPIPVVNPRSAPSGPARTAAASQSADPFADSPSSYSLPSPRAASRFSSASGPTPKMMTLTYSSYSYPSVQLPRVQDDQRTSKLVANVLLSRTNGRPMRRRAPMPAGEQRPYVKSCLSKMVEVEC